jgi:hypothetical protein
MSAHMILPVGTHLGGNLRNASLLVSGNSIDIKKKEFFHVESVCF